MASRTTLRVRATRTRKYQTLSRASAQSSLACSSTSALFVSETPVLTHCIALQHHRAWLPRYRSTGRELPGCHWWVHGERRGHELCIPGTSPISTFVKRSIMILSVPPKTVAAVISLLNDFLISQGKPPLGFLNPLLYSTGTAGLNDITSGSNPGCGTAGFTAVKGWDPVRIVPSHDPYGA